ncbi:MAG TPA: LPS export ABC transporter periplasmic protein LptC [Gemmatimonadaceae bacterium]|nr:LPS export ABC transporter periplasmic protein LptC [Gemmatimonadaceae bacterium]
MRALLLPCVLALWFATLACNDTTEPPVAAANPLADSADQVMWSIKVMLTDQGINRARLESDTAFFFDQSSRIELRNVRTTFFDQQGKRSAVLTSREGTYATRAGITEARGNVIVLSEDGRRLDTQQLKYSPQTNRISSDSAFVLTEPTRRLEGIGFTSDPDMNNVQVHRLRGGEGGQINLPGQGQTP